MLFVVADQDAPGLLERAYFGGESSGAAADAALALQVAGPCQGVRCSGSDSVERTAGLWNEWW